MQRAVFVTHVPHEGAGLAGEIAAELGFRVETVEAHQGEPLPTNLGSKDVLVVMGGPMGVRDLQDPRFPWLEPTVALLRERLAKDYPSLGICLGCQLMAHAAGAKVQALQGPDGVRIKELGWLPIRMESSDDDLTRGLPGELTVLHWHGDGCALPSGATWLASSEVCPVQMFRIGKNVGVQFHPEVDAATACLWAEEDAVFVREAHGPDGVEQVRRDCERMFGQTDSMRRELLRRIFRLAMASDTEPSLPGLGSVPKG
jgi:GMP synthase (glutamine-hydrolysing)